MSDLALLLAQAQPADLLPTRRTDEAGRVLLPWSLVAAVGLRPSSGADSELLLLVVEDARGERFGVPAVVEAGRLRRAGAGDGAAEVLVSRLAAGEPMQGLRVEVFGDFEAPTGESAFDVDQTNDLVAVGERAVVKWYLHPTDDQQPAPLRMATLARAGFEGTPRTWAIIGLDGPQAGALVATVVEYLPDTEDGWDWAVDSVRTMARGGGGDDQAWVRDVAALIGRMHVALASSGTEEASPELLAAWLATAADELARYQDRVGDEAYLAARGRLGIIAECVGTPLLDAHGDLHIGQILRTKDATRYFVVDFDGNPTLPAAERTARQPAARDVAGMLASLDHVGRVVLQRTDDLDNEQRQRVLDWIEDAQVTFLDAYHVTLAEAGCVDLLDDRLVLPFHVQQEFREYAYAERYLPHWRYVPDAALPALLKRGHA